MRSCSVRSPQRRGLTNGSGKSAEDPAPVFRDSDAGAAADTTARKTENSAERWPIEIYVLDGVPLPIKNEIDCGFVSRAGN